MSQDKTEEPTPKRLLEARRKGQVPRSRELTTAAMLLVVGAVLKASGASAVESFTGLYATMMGAVQRAGIAVNAGGASATQDAASTAGAAREAAGMLSAGARAGLEVLAPVLLAAMLVAGVVGFLQVGPVFSTQAVRVDPSRLDPLRALKQLFSQRQAIELVKALLKVGVVGYVVTVLLLDSVRGVAGLAARDASASLHAGGALLSAMLLRVGGVLLAVGVLDLLYQRWRHRHEHRMTRDEVRREHREAEGDPHAKRERERLRREILEHATLEEVRRADVLVVNPTHVAVALRYDEAVHDAPEVIARGQDSLARRMIAAAEEAGVPVLRDIPLARALYELEEGDLIPERLFDAVAAVLHAAWQERAEREGDDERLR